MKKSRIIAAVVTALAIVNLAVLLVWPEKIAKTTGIEESSETENVEKSNTGSGQAALEVAEEEKTYNGKGKFDPLEGVKALDIDGTEITGKIAISYTPGNSIQEKKIHYTVYDSQSEKLEAVATLKLEGYKGPDIHVDDIASVTWDELQRLPSILAEERKITVDDGFGNDATSSVGYSYEILEDYTGADVTFSFVNEFQDYWSVKMVIAVEDIPVEQLENEIQ